MKFLSTGGGMAADQEELREEGEGGGVSSEEPGLGQPAKLKAGDAFKMGHKRFSMRKKRGFRLAGGGPEILTILLIKVNTHTYTHIHTRVISER